MRGNWKENEGLSTDDCVVGTNINNKSDRISTFPWRKGTTPAYATESVQYNTPVVDFLNASHSQGSQGNAVIHIVVPVLLHIESFNRASPQAF